MRSSRAKRNFAFVQARGDLPPAETRPLQLRGGGRQVQRARRRRLDPIPEAAADGAPMPGRRSRGARCTREDDERAAGDRRRTARPTAARCRCTGRGSTSASRRQCRACWLTARSRRRRRARPRARTAAGRFMGARAVLAVNSCTAALEMAIRIAGLGAGDEVILPSFTFVSTANAVLNGGARPVFADIDPATLGLDPADVARRITPRTRAILPMHYAGMACDMAALDAIAERHGLLVIEDAAHGAERDLSRRGALGACGALGTLSFHETKDLVCGEGGALVVRDDEATTARGRDPAREGHRPDGVPARRTRQVHVGRHRQQLRAVGTARRGRRRAVREAARDHAPQDGAGRTAARGARAVSRRRPAAGRARRMPPELARLRRAGRSGAARLGAAGAPRRRRVRRLSLRAAALRAVRAKLARDRRSRSAGNRSRRGLARPAADLARVHRCGVRRTWSRRACEVFDRLANRA